jgi:hypothetical protein
MKAFLWNYAPQLALLVWIIALAVLVLSTVLP